MRRSCLTATGVDSGPSGDFRLAWVTGGAELSVGGDCDEVVAEYQGNLDSGSGLAAQTKANLRGPREIRQEDFP